MPPETRRTTGSTPVSARRRHQAARPRTYGKDMPEPLTAEQAARRKGVSRQAVVQAARARKIQAVRDGRRWRIDVESLDAWHPRAHPARNAGASSNTPPDPIELLERVDELQLTLSTVTAERDALKAQVRALQAAARTPS